MQFNRRPITAVLFDMDGTMFDTERLRFETINQASLEICGRPIGEDILVGSLGLSAVRAEALAKAHHGADYPYRQIRERADTLELAHARRHGVPIKTGLQAVLERLRKSGLRLAVATSSRREIALEYLINAGVMKYFDVTVCGDEVEQGKPHPEIFLTAANKLGIDIETSLIVEDSENGLRAATASGGMPIYIRDIKDPSAEVLAGAFRAYDDMLGFLDDLRLHTERLPSPSLFDPFPSTTSHLTVGIHGFGAIGGGFLAQIFSHWDGYTRPREIIGVTGDATIRDLVNAFGKYTVRYLTHAFDQTIDGITLIDSANEQAVIDMYVKSNLIGLALPEAAIRNQSALIAKGLIARFEAGAEPVVILTILNKIGGAAFVREAVKARLDAMVAPERRDAILAATRFPEAVVNRIVTRISPEALARQARIKLNAFEMKTRERVKKSAQDLSPGATNLPSTTRQRLKIAAEQARVVENLNLVLFHSEPDMLVYAGKGDPLLEELRQIRTVNDIAQVQTVKNRLWNGPHAILAWYGHLLGYETIGQAMGDERVSGLLERMAREEIIPALTGEVPELSGDLPAFVQTFTDRCRRSFRDPCIRVGRDPLRKLQRHERILKSIDAARRKGLSSHALEFGVALAVRYALAQPNDQESQIIARIVKENGGIADLLTRAEPVEGKPMPGLDRERDAGLIARIGAHFTQLDDVLARNHPTGDQPPQLDADHADHEVRKASA